MSKTGQRLSLVLGLAVLLGATTMSIGQEKKQKKEKALEKELQKKAEEVAKNDPAKVEKIELLTEQVQKAQAALEAELKKQLGDSLKTEALGTEAFEKGRDGQKKEIVAAEKALVEAVKKHGKKSKEVRKARQRLQEARVPRGLAEPDAGVGLNTEQLYKEGNLGATLPDAELEALSEKGEILIQRGRELKLVALAKKIEQCKDPKKKKALIEELETLAEEAQSERREFREKKIKDLESQLKTLQAQSENAKSAEEVVDELLNSKKKKEKGGKKEKSKKEKKEK